MNSASKRFAAARICALTCAIALLAPTTWAQGPMGRGSGAGGGPGSMMPNFATFDKDGDGKISQTEFEETRAQRIAERSQQGYQMRGLANAPTFADLDANSDASLDPSEFSAGLARHHGGPPPRP